MSAPDDPAAAIGQHFRQALQGKFDLEPAGKAVNSSNWFVHTGGERRYLLKHAAPSSVTDFYAAFCKRTPLLPALVGAAGAWRLLEYRAGGPFPGTSAARVAAARALAQLHLALRSEPGSAPFSQRYLPLSPREMEAARAQEPAVVAKVPQWTAELAALEATPGLPRGWVHHDFHPGNVLFDNDRVTAILDMDSLGTDYRMQAVAFAASRFGDADAFVAGYDELDRLGHAEKHRRAAFVRREALRRVNWILREAIAGGAAWRGDLQKHLAALDA